MGVGTPVGAGVAVAVGVGVGGGVSTAVGAVVGLMEISPVPACVIPSGVIVDGVAAGSYACEDEEG